MIKCGGMCGGVGDVKEATGEIQELCDKVKNEAQSQTGKNFEVFKAKHYTSQVVSGVNYFIKVHVGGDDHVHLRVHRQLPCNGGAVELHGIQEGKTLQDTVAHF